jgi:hypothetical protein
MGMNESLDYDDDGFQMSRKQREELDDWFNVSFIVGAEQAGIIIVHVGRWFRCR